MGRKYRCTGLLVIGLLFLSAGPVFADGLFFDFEHPTNLLVFNGTARTTTSQPLAGLTSGQLTDLATSSVLGQGAAGSIILANRIPTSFFDVSFLFNLSGGESVNPSGFFADGITFSVLGAASPNLLGLCCSGLGYAEAVLPNVPAFSIEFDTYDNGAIDTCFNLDGSVGACPPDSPAPHIAVSLGALGIFSTLRDQALVPVEGLHGQPHSARIRMSNSLLNVYLDNNPVIQNFFVPPEYISPMAFVGFTGSTGSYSDIQTVDNLSVTAVPEPGSVLLLVAGLGMIGFVMYQRRTRDPLLTGELRSK